MEVEVSRATEISPRGTTSLQCRQPGSRRSVADWVDQDIAEGIEPTPIREHAPYRHVLSRYLDRADVDRQVETLRHNRRLLVSLVLDQHSRVLWPYTLFDAVRRLTDEV